MEKQLLVINLLIIFLTQDKNLQAETTECLREGLSERSENEVNYCIAIQRDIYTSCNYFDLLECGNKSCLLGYETDSQGCIRSCDCKKKGLHQGDIMVNENEFPKLKEMLSKDPTERGASKLYQRWTFKRLKGLYIIPYLISREIWNNVKTRKAIREAFQQFRKHTCLVFVPKKSSDPHYLKFVAGEDGCWSYVGLIGGEQHISLGDGCGTRGIVMHELMHSLGFFHEHSRPDRDDFVHVIEKNVKPEYLKDFKKFSYKEIDSMGSPYDLGSIMHYSGKDFSKNPNYLWTIVYKNTNVPVIAQREGFSQEDIIQLNKMYKCSS